MAAGLLGAWLVAGVSGALGQDSVSTTAAPAGSPPGDAVSAYAVGANSEQINNYVVDLAPITSSWAGQWNLGPVIKSSASSNTTDANLFVGAQAASNRFTGTQALLRPSYLGWKTAGQGVNATRNAAPASDGSGKYGTVSASGISAQSFGVAMVEYGAGPNTLVGDGDDESNVIAAIIGFDPRANSRVYVSRVTAAANKPSASQGMTATALFGLGGIDEAGDVHFSADGYGLTGTGALSDKRLLRVDATLRGPTLVNTVSSSGFGDAAASKLLGSGAVHQTTPTIISRVMAGRAVMLGADLANDFEYEHAAGALTSTTAHVGTGVSVRGPLSYTSQVFIGSTGIGGTGGTGGTVAALSRSAGATRTRGISVFGVNVDGSVAGKMQMELPTAAAGIVDHTDGYDPSAVFGSLASQAFMNYQSQVCFRGGNGPVAAVVLPNGDLLVAAGVAASGGGSSTPQAMDNYLAVARTTGAPGSNPVWVVAAHTGDARGAGGGTSKAIMGYDQSGAFTTIGRIAKYNEVFPNASGGPSISAPAMDRMGNLYFLATVAMSDGSTPAKTVGLVRANFDMSTNEYRLELIARVGQVIAGLNSATNYQIQFMSPADADSVDSGAVWSSSVVQDFNSIVRTSRIAYASPQGLGALVFRAKIVYDTDGNGQYVDPAGPNGTGTDQAYNVEMLLLPRVTPGCNIADIVSVGQSPPPDGLLTGDDYVAFINAFFTGNLLADVVSVGQEPPPDGLITGDDYVAFINAFFTGCGGT